MLEARAELDSLEELMMCPLVAANPRPYADFFASAPALLAPATTPERFQAELVALLFPALPYLGAFSCESGSAAAL